MSLRNMMYIARSHFLFSGKYEKVVLDVPFGTGTVDMVLIDKKGRATVLLFEEKYWKRALRQAREYALGAYKTYICLPEASWPPELQISAQEQGLGVYLCNTGTAQIRRLTSPHPGLILGSLNEALLTAANARWDDDHTPRSCDVVLPPPSMH